MSTHTHVQEMDELEVVGHAPSCRPEGLHDGSPGLLDSLGEEEEEESYSEDSLSSNEDNSPIK